MKKVLLIAALLPLGVLNAQISNGGFDASVNPSGFNKINLASGWKNANGGTADLYSSDSKKCTKVNASAGATGMQAPFDGKTFAGIIVYYNDESLDLIESIKSIEPQSKSGYGKYSEYITTELGSPLTAGKSYTFSFYASLADNSGYASGALGAVFSEKHLCQSSNSFIMASPQVVTSGVITDKSGWTKISGSFTAKGGEKFITIGAFNGASDIQKVDGGKGITGRRAYYYIDGVSLTDGGVVEKDSDGDGVPDSMDACPTVKGTLKGCPDSDGDGVADNLDECPDVPGTVKGCPENDKDSDGDGVADSKDACPTVKGTIKGCPDSDGDGVADKDDACPTVKGTVAGCPDRDGDGVADKDDKCPDVPGLKQLAGCVLDQTELDEIRKASEKILFNSGSAVIKQESYADLDKIAAIMKKHPEVKADIEGHTDSQGRDDLNLELSKKRAAAVKDYLVSKGVEADHLSSEGYGETKPIADNATPEGRAKNRRVIVVTSTYKASK